MNTGTTAAPANAAHSANITPAHRPAGIEVKSTDELFARAQAACAHAVSALFELQNPDGHWCAELEGDSITNSEYLLMKWMLREESDSRLPKIADYLRHAQRADGGWGQYPGSPVDVSATVKGYVALRLAGHSADAPHMQLAEHAVRINGGAEASNSFSNFYLAGLGLIDWDACPAIPPEMVFAPRWSPFHLDHFSAWSRTMLLPLAICSALRPVRSLPDDVTIDHLFLDPDEKKRLSRRIDRKPFTWHNGFLAVDHVLKSLQHAGAMPLRKQALQIAERWLLQRMDVNRTDGLGAIFPPMVYAQVALDALGYPRSHPVRVNEAQQLDALMLEDERGIRVQPCFSPVWDTGIALFALADCGLTQDHATKGMRIERTCRWLRSKQVHFAGDWSRSVDASAAGWSFEYHNDWYPDVDDTAMVAMALARTGGWLDRSVAQTGIRWLLALQNDDGGWAAFDRTKDRPVLEAVPFADHNAIQDPSCADITGRVLESLAYNGYHVAHRAVQRAIQFLQRTQNEDGTWFGRWGVNYIYGTWQAIGGLSRIGIDMDEPWIRRAGAWLKSVQHEDGSFGESANSYLDPTLKGQGRATASQTAWAAMTMMEIFGRDDHDVRRAIHWLCKTQITSLDEAPAGYTDPPGSWPETEFTGTGFPKVYYLRYHLYRLYFPLMALARFANAPDHRAG